MANEKGYNGWANYETWEVKLELDNDEGLYDSIRELAKDEHDSVSRLADNIREFVESMIEDLYPKVFEYNFIVSTALSTFLSEVDWHEIAEHVIDDFKEDWADDEETDISEDDEGAQ